MTSDTVHVDAALAGQRLDQALAALEGLLPGLSQGLGLRGRRRLIARGVVLVNGSPAVAARRLRTGDVLSLCDGGAEQWTGLIRPDKSGAAAHIAAHAPRLLCRQGDYCFLYKPAGLHCVALAGGGGPSLEALLPELLHDLLPDMPSAPLLLQRLDYGTSGIVGVALGQAAARAFRRAERAGQCEKRYLALLRGTLTAPRTARQGLNTARRRQSRILADTSDALRWTDFFPLHVWEGAAAVDLLTNLGHSGEGASVSGAASGAALAGLTLAVCRIRCGARHQIRAHAAALGHPLWGDGLYAPEGSAPDEGFFLHHGAIFLPQAACAQPPPWPLPKTLVDVPRKWLESPTQWDILTHWQCDDRVC